MTRRLSKNYIQWERQSDAKVVQAIKSGTIIPDTNVLLSLYEIATESRNEIIELFERVVARLWMPHQVAIEFSRNRQRVIVDREKGFSSAQKEPTLAPSKAFQAIQSALSAIERLNQRNRSTQDWKAENLGLNKSEIQKVVRDLLEPARAELERLQAEHDIAPGSAS